MTGGNFWIITAGLSKGISSTGFLAGVTADVSGRIRRRFYTCGVGNSLVGGSSFGKGLLAGLRTLEGGIAGGLIGGLDALGKGTNFQTGKTSLDLSQGYAASGNFKIGETTVTGKYVGTYKGQNVFESSKLGSYKTGKYSGVTIPEQGIIVGKGVFTYRGTEGMAMM